MGFGGGAARRLRWVVPPSDVPAATLAAPVAAVLAATRRDPEDPQHGPWRPRKAPIRAPWDEDPAKWRQTKERGLRFVGKVPTTLIKAFVVACAVVFVGVFAWEARLSRLSHAAPMGASGHVAAGLAAQLGEKQPFGRSPGGEVLQLHENGGVALPWPRVRISKAERQEPVAAEHGGVDVGRRDSVTAAATGSGGSAPGIAPTTSDTGVRGAGGNFGGNGSAAPAVGAGRLGPGDEVEGGRRDQRVPLAVGTVHAAQVQTQLDPLGAASAPKGNARGAAAIGVISGGGGGSAGAVPTAPRLAADSRVGPVGEIHAESAEALAAPLPPPLDHHNAFSAGSPLADAAAAAAGVPRGFGALRSPAHAAGRDATVTDAPGPAEAIEQPHPSGLQQPDAAPIDAPIAAAVTTPGAVAPGKEMQSPSPPPSGPPLAKPASERSGSLGIASQFEGAEEIPALTSQSADAWPTGVQPESGGGIKPEAVTAAGGQIGRMVGSPGGSLPPHDGVAVVAEAVDMGSTRRPRAQQDGEVHSGPVGATAPSSKLGAIQVEVIGSSGAAHAGRSQTGTGIALKLKAGLEPLAASAAAPPPQTFSLQRRDSTGTTSTLRVGAIHLEGA